MKRISKCLLVTLAALLLCLSVAGCSSSKADPCGGEYLFVWEHISVMERTNLDYKFILDGHGKGEYHHKGSVHKIKYEYQTGGDIKIHDTITGIDYNGTCINGELHIYDGNPENPAVSEFLYRAK